MIYEWIYFFLFFDISFGACLTSVQELQLKNYLVGWSVIFKEIACVCCGIDSKTAGVWSLNALLYLFHCAVKPSLICDCGQLIYFKDDSTIIIYIYMIWTASVSSSLCVCIGDRFSHITDDAKIKSFKLPNVINSAEKNSLNSLICVRILFNLLVFLPQEQKVNGVHVSVPTPSSCTFSIGSNSLDREMLKKIGIGLALAAVILAYIVQRVYWTMTVVCGLFYCNVNTFSWQSIGMVKWLHRTPFIPVFLVQIIHQI